MNRLMIRAFIQARLSSARFPGKVLAPLNGAPIIAQVISRVGQVVERNRIVVATSDKQSDDPLACYVEQLGICVYRGSLNDVFRRFQSCLEAYPCDWFFRVCADSPLLDSGILQRMLDYVEDPAIDLVTNVWPRTYPKGQSAEMIRSSRFAQIDPELLSAEEREHITKFYYNHGHEFRILNLESENSALAQQSFAVDTFEDLERLERVLRGGNFVHEDRAKYGTTS